MTRTKILSLAAGVVTGGLIAAMMIVASHVEQERERDWRHSIEMRLEILEGN